MSAEELRRVEVIALRRSGKISQAEAARRLRLCERQVRRLEAKVAAMGAAGLRSGRRGRPSNRAVPAPVRSQVAALIGAHYRDFGPTLASEYLQQRHGLVLCKETVRKLMIEAHLWRPRRGAKARLHALRVRRACFGELIQVDGSLHDWFEGRAAPCCLLVFIDDATSRLTQLRFVERESTLGYMHALYDHIRAYGLPMALYSDRHGIFRVNVGDAQDDHQTQFGRALSTLGIDSICATSPQAKGRVERVNGLLQDRLVKAMRIASIQGIDQANGWLPGFVARHNARFAVAPFDPRDAHARYDADPAADAQLRRILAKHHFRRLSRNLSCQFDSTLLQLRPGASCALRGAHVAVLQHFDQTLELLWRNAALPYDRLDKPRGAPAHLTRKEVSLRKPHVVQPRPNHPWKTTPIGRLSPEFVIRT